jgi:hypothetical protein
MALLRPLLRASPKELGKLVTYYGRTAERRLPETRIGALQDEPHPHITAVSQVLAGRNAFMSTTTRSRSCSLIPLAAALTLMALCATLAAPNAVAAPVQCKKMLAKKAAATTTTTTTTTTTMTSSSDDDDGTSTSTTTSSSTGSGTGSGTVVVQQWKEDINWQEVVLQ